jgi:hypothetical protein
MGIKAGREKRKRNTKTFFIFMNARNINLSEWKTDTSLRVNNR